MQATATLLGSPANHGNIPSVSDENSPALIPFKQYVLQAYENGKKFGELPKVKRVLSICFGALNATITSISWGTDKLCKKF